MYRASRPGKETAKHYYNTHEEIEALSQRMLDRDIKPDVAIFDVSMIYATADLVKRNLITLPVRLMFVVGGHMALGTLRFLYLAIPASNLRNRGPKAVDRIHVERVQVRIR